LTLGQISPADHLALPLMWLITNSYASASTSSPSARLGAAVVRKCTPPQKRLSPQSLAQSVQLSQPITVSLADVTLGSITDVPGA